MAVADVFGYHALQLGLPELDGLRANRMPHRWLALDGADTAASGVAPAGVALVTDFAALPFAAGSLDLVVLPHSLDLHLDPHATLREVERVLVPEGRVVICGFNPYSLWGFRQCRDDWLRRLGSGGEDFLPATSERIGYWRLRDWLRLLSFEVESGQFGCYRLAVRSARWLQRLAWMDNSGDRWWPILGAAYLVVAVKRVRGMKLLEAGWKPAPLAANAPVPVANRARPWRAPLE